MNRLQERIAAFDGDVFKKGNVAAVVDAAHAALRRNYPLMTREEVAELVGLENMIDVFQAVMDVSGALRRDREAQAGEGTPPGGA